MLGIQMIDRIEYIHSRKIIHTNLKPNSFLLGKNSKSHILYLSDFVQPENIGCIKHILNLVKEKQILEV